MTLGARGFSLVEMLVVVALIGIISVFVIPSISSQFNLSLNSAGREMGAIIKEAYNSALVTGKVHRVVYDLKDNAYWVEVGPATALLDTTESREREERKKRFSKDKDEKPKESFGMAKSVTRSKKSLPRGVTFEDVLTQQAAEPIVEGKAFTHFFPHGITEQTIIHIKDTAKHHASLVISPIVGRTDVYDRYVTGEEAFAK